MKRVLIACDKFKGSLTAIEACHAVQRGLGEEWLADLCPLADGGEGFVDTMVSAMRGEKISVPCHDALGREILAEYGIVKSEGKTIAVIEMASASGMWRVAAKERDVMASDTYGTGELMRHAAEVTRADAMVVGLGGSATNDGGAGMAAALGVKFFDKSGRELLPSPRALESLAAVDGSGRIALPPIQVACDVDNPLCGPRGASAVYGPQKGATAALVQELDAHLQRLSELVGASDLAMVAGAGAAGGLGFGLLAFAGAELVPGFALVAERANLRQRVLEADLVVTGEGSLDEQSLHGKGPVGLAKMCRELGVPCVAVAGRCAREIGTLGIFDDAIDLIGGASSVEESIARASELLERRVAEKAIAWRDWVARAVGVRRPNG